MRTPSHGGSSGKHVAQFRLPQSVKYTETGRYSTDGSEATKVLEGPAPPKKKGHRHYGRS